jgi:C2H2 type zinc-finger (2 copies)
MKSVHRLIIGKLHNLVYVEELLNLISYLVNERHICLFCEHAFPSVAVLKKHSRTSQHYLKLRPDNTLYDKYYIVNYMPPDAKTEAEVSIDTSASSVLSTNEDDEANWSAWDEPLDMGQPVQCLFDDTCCEDVSQLLEEHLKKVHSFDLHAYFARHSLELYDRIKLINYIRLETSHLRCFQCSSAFQASEGLQKHLKQQGHLMSLPESDIWRNAQYLLPAIESDPLLCFLDISEDEDGLDVA